MKSVLVSLLTLSVIGNVFAKDLNNKQKAGIGAAIAAGNGLAYYKLHSALHNTNLKEIKNTLFYVPGGKQLTPAQMDEIANKAGKNKRFWVETEHAQSSVHTVQKGTRLHSIFDHSGKGLLKNEELRSIAARVKPGQNIRIDLKVNYGYGWRSEPTFIRASNANQLYSELKSLQDRSSKAFIKNVSIVERVKVQQTIFNVIKKNVTVKGDKRFLRKSLHNLQGNGKIVKVSIKPRISKALLRKGILGGITVTSLATMGSSIYAISKGFSGAEDKASSRFNGKRQSGKEINRKTASSKVPSSKKTVTQ